MILLLNDMTTYDILQNNILMFPRRAVVRRLQSVQDGQRTAAAVAARGGGRGGAGRAAQVSVHAE
jgi:hypothetical protein